MSLSRKHRCESVSDKNLYVGQFQHVRSARREHLVYLVFLTFLTSRYLLPSPLILKCAQARGVALFGSLKVCPSSVFRLLSFVFVFAVHRSLFTVLIVALSTPFLRNLWRRSRRLSRKRHQMRYKSPQKFVFLQNG